MKIRTQKQKFDRRNKMIRMNHKELQMKERTTTYNGKKVEGCIKQNKNCE